MKIRTVRVREVEGGMPTDGPFWEERLLRPIDIYPDYRTEMPPWGGEQVDDNNFRLKQWFVQIEADEGSFGIAGPIWPDAARLILMHHRRGVASIQYPVGVTSLRIHELRVSSRIGGSWVQL